VLELAQQLTPKEICMQKIVISVPAMYGDHHVLEVRRILFEMPGVAEVKASSWLQTVEVTFDPARLNPAHIKNRLAEAGYLDALPVAAESGRSDSPLVQGGQDGLLRHTVAYAQSKQVVSFAQNVHPADRPLWPCPGFDLITPKER
jgi:copper chaperone CopZ